MLYVWVLFGVLQFRLFVNVVLTPVIFMTELPGLIVKLPGSPAAFHEPDTFNVDEPRFNTRTAD